MELYHGSTVVVKNAKIITDGNYKDFDMVSIVLI